MRQLTFAGAVAGAGAVEWRDAPAPAIGGAGEAIVAPLVVGRCDLDVAYVRGLAPLAPGSAIGHEMIGEVIDVGDAVVGVRPGQRVIVPSQISCGVCRNCQRGFTGRCQNVPFGASYGMGREGGYGCAVADLVRVPFADAMLAPLPDGADPVGLIGAADMALDSWRAVGPQLAERPGATLLVMGGLASGIGLYAAGLAKVLGAGRVDYADEDEARLAVAARYGATPVRLPADLPDQYEIVVDACGTAEALLQAIRATEPEGHVTSVVIHLRPTTPLPLLEMYHKGIFYRTGRANCRPAVAPVLDACKQGFDPGAVASRVYPFDEAPAAWMDDGLRTVATRV